MHIEKIRNFLKKELEGLFGRVKNIINLDFKIIILKKSFIKRIRIYIKREEEKILKLEYPLKEDEKYLENVAKSCYSWTLLRFLEWEKVDLEDLGRKTFSFLRVLGHSLNEIKNLELREIF